jgi:trehalose synthase
MTVETVELSDVTVTPLPPERFNEVLRPEALAAFARTIERGREVLEGRKFWSVNSTARGGGVAEMLLSLIGYARGAGIDARWVVVPGDADFFRVTKRLHNRLHGADDGAPLGEVERAVYERWCRASAEALARRVQPGDVVLLHDPQTAGMVPRMLETGVPVIWRAHIGLDLPNDAAREAWRFLLPYVEPATEFIFSRPAYAWEGLDRERLIVIPPSIDAFSPKNQNMSYSGITAVLRAAGLAADHHHHSRAVFERLDGSVGNVESAAKVIEEHQIRLDVPLVVQVSRWDRLKDPLGVLAGFAEHVRADEDPHLVLAGPDVTAVADDPEGAEVLAEVQAVWEGLPRAVRRRVHLALLPMGDTDEKSLAEGFGLTVSEAMWKGRPVVASDVGGIQDQIEDGLTGRLVEPHDLGAFGACVSELLADPHGAERLGAAAQARVRDHFLGPRHLGQYVDLLEQVLRGR